MSNKLYDETSIQNIANAIRNKNGSSDLYTVGQMAQAILDIPTGDGDGDITWERELIEKWDFTKSLEGSAGDTFILTAGASRTSEGIVFNGSAPTVDCNLKSTVDDWLKVGVAFECDGIENLGTNSQLSFFGCEGGLFEMYNNSPYNQVFPRDYYNPSVSQRLEFRNFYLDPNYGFYSFNRYLATSSSIPELFKVFNDNIRDGNNKFLIGGYNNYGTPPNGFVVKSLAIYRNIEKS